MLLNNELEYLKINGILPIYKPEGISSHEAVYKIRKKFLDFLKLTIKDCNLTNKEYKKLCPKIGHTGTLDPFAKGLLLMCIGDATKLTNELQGSSKEYISEIKFGIKTSTDDITGEVLSEEKSIIKIEDIKNIINKFLGEIEQFPPIYSAISLDGRRLYDYARKNIEVKIPSRKVFIEKFDILDFKEKDQILKVKIVCSSGTYIRSIARDFGNELGTFGTLYSLERTRVGDFFSNDSYILDEIILNEINEKVIPLEKFFINNSISNKNQYKYINTPIKIKKIILNEITLNKFLNGDIEFLKNVEFLYDTEIRLFFLDKIIGIVEYRDKFRIKYLFKNNC